MGSRCALSTRDESGYAQRWGDGRGDPLLDGVNIHLDVTQGQRVPDHRDKTGLVQALRAP